MSFELKAHKTSHYGPGPTYFPETPHFPTMNDVSDGKENLWRYLLVFVSAFAAIITFPLSLLVCTVIVKEYERVVVFRLGRLHHGTKGPGMLLVLPCIEDHVIVDMRTFTATVPRQSVLTKDLVSISVDAVIYYHIHNPTLAETTVVNPHNSTQLLGQTILRSVFGRYNYSELLASRESVSAYMQKTLDDITDDWGIKIERIDIKEFHLPKNMQRAMAAEAEACRGANANLIAAEGEKKASLVMKEAGDVMSQCPLSIQLRCLQTLTNVAANDNRTITFPLPIDLLQLFNDDDESSTEVENNDSGELFNLV